MCGTAAAAGLASIAMNAVAPVLAAATATTAAAPPLLLLLLLLLALAALPQLLL
jgi:hypothetical protein